MSGNEYGTRTVTKKRHTCGCVRCQWVGARTLLLVGRPCPNCGATGTVSKLTDLPNGLRGANHA